MAEKLGVSNKAVSRWENGESFIMMVLSFALIFAVNLSQSLSAGEGRDKLSKISKIVAVCSVLWIMMITWALVIMAVNGYVPFGMELTSVALFVNSQLRIIFVCNLVLIIIFAYRFIKYGETVHWGCFVSMAAIYMTVLYSDLLGNRSTVQGFIKSLGTRTIVTVLVMGIFITISVIAEKKRQLR